MRIFISVNFNKDIISQITRVQDRLRKLEGRGGNGRYSKPENLHITLAFLGETPKEKINDVKSAMDSVTATGIHLKFDDLGYFLMGKNQDQQLWWVGVHENAQLKQLQKDLVKALKEKDLKPDTKSFKPHVTIAKKLHLRKWDRNALLPESFSTDAGYISLMVSEGEGENLKYTEIYRKKL